MLQFWILSSNWLVRRRISRTKVMQINPLKWTHNNNSQTLLQLFPKITFWLFLAQPMAMFCVWKCIYSSIWVTNCGGICHLLDTMADNGGYVSIPVIIAYYIIRLLLCPLGNCQSLVFMHSDKTKLIVVNSFISPLCTVFRHAVCQVAYDSTGGLAFSVVNSKLHSS